jgi:hypothetical protein
VVALAAGLLLAGRPPVAAQPAAPPAGGTAAGPAPATGPVESLAQRLAVWRFDALGIEPELVARLEALFRMELDRLAKQPLPSRREVDRAVGPDLRDCTGQERCLGEIGKRLGVDVVITGTVGALGDAYVLDVKAVETASARQLARLQSVPLRGSPDELIEGVRVAAYRLLAPDQLHGAIQIQTDLVGAEVRIDGKAVGRTPLPQLGLVGKQPLGIRALRVEARGYAPFVESVEVRFQKVSQVVVRLVRPPPERATGLPPPAPRRPLYTRTWFLVSVGAVAAAAGAYAGWRAGHERCVRIVAGSEAGGC